ncbi:putative transcription factor TFIIIB component B'', Myb domain-containing protein [Helianthus annuus]|nr:putative transcription factor TFIIIB component B'', Myb domain-containing protein [Helianthus annuus]KAJ0884318.1 putative transcription factor TFIIIB component B'' [Helianthus annuus]
MQAIQQFGLDFSIITECFPGRTHKQIISKFKKEDKQHRLRIESAPNTRAKGNIYTSHNANFKNLNWKKEMKNIIFFSTLYNPICLNILFCYYSGLSLFEYVLERLKQARAEDSENNNDDPTGEEDEVQEAADNNKESELQKDVKEDMEADESLIKADDIEDEDTWNQYTGEI